MSAPQGLRPSGLQARAPRKRLRTSRGRPPGRGHSASTSSCPYYGTNEELPLYQPPGRPEDRVSGDPQPGRKKIPPTKGQEPHHRPPSPVGRKCLQKRKNQEGWEEHHHSLRPSDSREAAGDRRATPPEVGGPPSSPPPPEGRGPPSSPAPPEGRGPRSSPPPPPEGAGSPSRPPPPREAWKSKKKTKHVRWADEQDQSSLPHHPEEEATQLQAEGSRQPGPILEENSSQGPSEEQHLEAPRMKEARPKKKTKKKTPSCLSLRSLFSRVRKAFQKAPPPAPPPEPEKRRPLGPWLRRWLQQRRRSCFHPEAL
ncbi:basic salivary proline-rich protein 1-like [Lacerta agilis]|uniref:basic salivary proline-rich protein 1-like n=1 Tax=Lacerta agilis TaxID=80427 RepID=UPI001419BAE5|nr:basic salivary proline-rich protein 1-like [Lacerta agilis]